MMSPSAIWEHHETLVLGALVVVNAGLMAYVAKNFGKAVNQKPKTDHEKLTSGNKKVRLKAVRAIGRTDPSAHLFDIKNMIFDRDDKVALYAFKTIVFHSTAVNIIMLQNTFPRAQKKKVLFTACLKRVAETNPKLLLEFIQSDLPEWIFVNALKALAHAKVPELVSVLMTAQESSSPAIQETAKHLLAKLAPADPAVKAA